MTDDAKQDLIDEMLMQYQDKENDFAIIDEIGQTIVPSHSTSGLVIGYHPYEKYRGIVLEVNDHGNVTVWKQFYNGNRREIASRV